MIIQGIVSVCFWEYSIDVKRTKENSCSPNVCSAKKHHSKDFESANKVYQKNCKKRLLSPLRDIIDDMQDELNKFRRNVLAYGIMNTKKSAGNLGLKEKTEEFELHIKNSNRNLSRLNRTLIHEVEPQLKRCFRDDGANREKPFSFPSIDTSTLPLVVFVVSVSIVPILILGLFLLTHKCRACSD